MSSGEHSDLEEWKEGSISLCLCNLLVSLLPQLPHKRLTVYIATGELSIIVNALGTWQSALYREFQG